METGKEEWDEYSLLQTKIDKIGEFRFKIKGWTVTLVSGILVTVSASSLPGYITLFGIPIVLLFWLLERNEIELQKIMISRSLALERGWRRRRAEERKKTKKWLASWIVAGTRSLRENSRLYAATDKVFYGSLIILILLSAAIVSSGLIKRPSSKAPPARSMSHNEIHYHLSSNGEKSVVGEPQIRTLGETLDDLEKLAGQVEELQIESHYDFIEVGVSLMPFPRYCQI